MFGCVWGKALGRHVVGVNPPEGLRDAAQFGRSLPGAVPVPTCSRRPDHRVAALRASENQDGKEQCNDRQNLHDGVRRTDCRPQDGPGRTGPNQFPDWTPSPCSPWPRRRLNPASSDRPPGTRQPGKFLGMFWSRIWAWNVKMAVLFRARPPCPPVGRKPPVPVRPSCRPEKGRVTRPRHRCATIRPCAPGKPCVPRRSR